MCAYSDRFTTSTIHKGVVTAIMLALCDVWGFVYRARLVLGPLCLSENFSISQDQSLPHASALSICLSRGPHCIAMAPWSEDCPAVTMCALNGGHARAVAAVFEEHTLFAHVIDPNTLTHAFHCLTPGPFNETEMSSAFRPDSRCGLLRQADEYLGFAGANK